MNKKSFSFNLVYYVLGLSLFLISCHGNSVNNETPISGSIIIAVDETYKPILENELMVFSDIYPNAHVKILYMPYASLFQALKQDSIRLIFSGYDLDSNQLNEIEKEIHFPLKKTKLGFDAVAFITHPSNTNLTLTQTDIIDLLTGKKKDWKDINKERTGKLNIVFDNKNSSTTKYLLDSILINQTLDTNCFAVNTNEEVIHYVSKNPNSIGVIGVSWISNINDSAVQYFRNEIIPVRIKLDENSKAVAPYQAYIAEGSYAYGRSLIAYIKEAGPGLGHGFVNFVGGEKGQRIILKSGIVPSTMPIRNLRIRNKIKKY